MGSSLIFKGFAAWLTIAVCAMINGAVRDGVVTPRLGETFARPLSALTLLAIVYAITWVFVRWAGASVAPALLYVGLGWLGLTVTFEYALGTLRGLSSAQILTAYNPLSPTLWVFVLIGIAAAPAVVNRLASH